MLRGWLRAPLPGPAPPAWEGAGAAGRGLSCGLRARAATSAVAAEEEEEELKALRPRQAVLTGGTPGPRAAAGSPRGGLSKPVFVSAPAEGRVMSLLPGAGKQAGESHLPRALPPPRISAARRPPPRPELQGWGAPHRPAPGRTACKGSARSAGLRGWLRMRLRPEEAAVRARISVPLNPRPPPAPPASQGVGSAWTHLAARSGNAARHPVGLGTETRIEAGN